MYIFEAHYMELDNTDIIISFEIDAMLHDGEREVMKAAINKAMDMNGMYGEFYMLKLIAK